jgi:drug/metabolite transporter (DMT)-like permease
VRIRALALALVVFNVAGNFCLSVGMRSNSATDYIAAFANPWVLGGIVLLIGWIVAQLSLLSHADLTFVLPITAVSYVGSALLGAFALHEHVSVWRWSGVGLVALGVLIVGRTSPRTGQPQ